MNTDSEEIMRSKERSVVNAVNWGYRRCRKFSSEEGTDPAYCESCRCASGFQFSIGYKAEVEKDSVEEFVIELVKV